MTDESGSASGRGGTPFHCPFCGETDLWPHEPTGWECRGCLRAFTVNSLGMIRRASTTPEGGAS
ncbi:MULTISPECIES: hypothetical protein [unclassified Nocardioides]|uniref:hypothetical protein n=1 Tax=unclassified Nocardioides TaxID=2615069 RepID=UPI0009ECB9E4|nr:MULTISPECIES: hypothetical protein [unclassified Nocardioides]